MWCQKPSVTSAEPEATPVPPPPVLLIAMKAGAPPLRHPDHQWRLLAASSRPTRTWFPEQVLDAGVIIQYSMLKLLLAPKSNWPWAGMSIPVLSLRTKL
jgi:hypothetical protein